jgi:sortase A
MSSHGSTPEPMDEPNEWMMRRMDARMVGMAGGMRGANWRKKGWLAGSGAALLGVATTAVLIVTLDGGEAPAAAPATVAPTTAVTTSSTTVPPTTAAPTTVPATTVAPTTAPSISATRPTVAVERVVPTTVPPTTLPAQDTEPITPPGDSHAQEPVIELGSIAIPAIGVDMTMYEGIRMTTLDRGPGHWPGSALPGAVGNVVVGGHRTSKHAVFRHVDDLVAGDEIIFTGTDGAQHIYVVSGIEIVDPSEVWIVEPTPTPQATLFACHPPGSTRQRIIVFSDYRETIPAPTA